MISIFILFSKDRLPMFRQALDCFSDMEIYPNCQKILCVDGECEPITGFENVQVERPNKYYNWSAAWEKGVDAAEFDNILYIDADRILPVDFLTKILDLYEDNTFIFPAKIANMKIPVDTITLKKIRENILFYEDMYSLEERATSSENCIGRKNPMSGCVAFTKKTYLNSGKVDPYYEGWGYPDTDYFLQTLKKGFNFVSVPCTEIHIYHSNDLRKGKGLMNLWNGIRFCKKWKLPVSDFLKKQSYNLKVDINKIENFKDMESFVNHHLRNTFLI